MDISRFLNFRSKWQLIKDVILWTLCSLILLYVCNQLGKCFTIPFYIIHAPEPIRIALFFLLLVLLFLLLKDLFRWVYIFGKKNKIYVFNSKDWPNKWIFNGKTELIDKTYLFIKSSRAGCLLKDYYWKDFRMSFEMKFKTDNFRPQKAIGLIFRAEDLDNYFMIEIGQEFYDSKSGLKAHVRYKGGWELTSIEENIFNFSDFTKVSLEVKDDTARVFLKDDPIFEWTLPTHVDVNHIESGVKDEGEETKNITVRAFAGHVQEIPFRLKFGLVGFRAYMKHGAIIRGLKIEPL